MRYVPWSYAATLLSGPRRRILVTQEFGQVARHYLEVLAGTGGRLVLQAVYFLSLANALTLSDFGTFAAVAATGIMLGALSGFGFNFVAFRTAVFRPRLLGRYLGVCLIASALTLPLILLAAAPIYLAVFSGTLSFLSFALIITSESLFWRLIECLHKVNNGLGRFVKASLVIIGMAGVRALAAVIFALAGGGSLPGALDIWAGVYFGANGVITGLAFVLFCPPVRWTFSLKLFVGRAREAILPALSALVFDAQSEIDKLVIIVAAGQRAAGIYAISVRIIELAVVPVRSFFVLYSRKLIREQRLDNVICRNLLIEGAIFVTTLVGFAAFLYVLSFKPSLLGANVETARQLFGVAILVPALRALTEFHTELAFAYRKLGTLFALSAGSVLFKAFVLAILVTHSADPTVWGRWLNAIGAGLYLLSAIVIYRVLLSMRQPYTHQAPAQMAVTRPMGDTATIRMRSTHQEVTP